MATPELIEVARYRVILADCDPMRIMYYGAYLHLFEIGWTELFRRLGQPPGDYFARGLFFAVVDVHCRYMKPARYDNQLIIRAGFSEVRRSRLGIAYALLGPSGDLVASGTTTHAVVNDAGRPQRVPAEISAACAAPAA